MSSHPPDDGRLSQNSSESNSGDDQKDDSDIDELCARLNALKAAKAENMCQAQIDDDPMSPGQASGDTAMTELSTQSYLSDIDDRQVSDYLTESDSSRPSVVKDLISLRDGYGGSLHRTTGSSHRQFELLVVHIELPAVERLCVERF